MLYIARMALASHVYNMYMYIHMYTHVHVGIICVSPKNFLDSD